MSENKLINLLKDWGCDTCGALNRLLNDYELYTQCIKQFCTDENFDTLEKYILAKDAENAFDSAHALKGVAGNLGITPLFNAVSEIVEPLRRGNTDNLADMLKKVIACREKLIAIVNNG